MQFSIYILRVQINKCRRVFAGGFLTTSGIVYSLAGLVGLLQHLVVGLPPEVPKRSLIPSHISRDLFNHMVFIYLHCGLFFPNLFFIALQHSLKEPGSSYSGNSSQYLCTAFADHRDIFTEHSNLVVLLSCGNFHSRSMSLIRIQQQTVMKSLNYGQQTLLPFNSVIEMLSLLPLF